MQRKSDQNQRRKEGHRVLDDEKKRKMPADSKTAAVKANRENQVKFQQEEERDKKQAEQIAVKASNPMPTLKRKNQVLVKLRCR